MLFKAFAIDRNFRSRRREGERNYSWTEEIRVVLFFFSFSNAECLVASEQTLYLLALPRRLLRNGLLAAMSRTVLVHRFSTSLYCFITANARELPPSHNARPMSSLC